MVVDVGVVKNHIKPKANSTLYNMRKVDLIEYIRTLEHNYNVAVSFNENQARYIESLGIQKWISVKDRLPENDYGKHWKERQYYLVYLGSGTMRVAKYGFEEYDWWITCDDRVLTEKYQAGVTHWIPLPEPPKEDV